MILGGGNGSGKTTLANQMLTTHAYEYLGADLEAKILAPHDPDSAKIQAAEIVIGKFQQGLEQGTSLLYETTLAGRTLLRRIAQAQGLGYQVSLAFIFLDSPQVALPRVRERVRKSGHFVPDTDVIRRFHRSNHNFWNLYRQEVDSWHLFYNGGTQILRVAVGNGDNHLIVDSPKWELFHQLLQEK